MLRVRIHYRGHCLTCYASIESYQQYTRIHESRYKNIQFSIDPGYDVNTFVHSHPFCLQPIDAEMIRSVVTAQSVVSGRVVCKLLFKLLCIYES